MKKVICIVGKKRSGKDTVAEYIRKNENSEIYKLAYPIKHALVASSELSFKDVDGEGIDREKSLGYNSSTVSEILRKSLDYHNLEFDKLDEFVREYDDDSWSIRTLMQRFGTDLVCNKIDQNFWTNYALDVCNKAKTHVIISDVRQQWELDALRAIDSVIIHIKRDGINNNADMHSTESGLPSYDGDFVVENNGSLDELFKKVNKILKDI